MSTHAADPRIPVTVHIDFDLHLLSRNIAREQKVTRAEVVRTWLRRGAEITDPYTMRPNKTPASVRVQVRQEDLDTIDAFAAQRRLTRSEAVREALEAWAAGEVRPRSLEAVQDDVEPASGSPTPF